MLLLFDVVIVAADIVDDAVVTVAFVVSVAYVDVVVDIAVVVDFDIAVVAANTSIVDVVVDVAVDIVVVACVCLSFLLHSWLFLCLLI